MRIFLRFTPGPPDTILGQSKGLESKGKKRDLERVKALEGYGPQRTFSKLFNTKFQSSPLISLQAPLSFPPSF